MLLAELSFLGSGLLANPSSSSHHLALSTGCLSGGQMTDAAVVVRLEGGHLVWQLEWMASGAGATWAFLGAELLAYASS